jgi:cystathionine beta-lyase
MSTDFDTPLDRRDTSSLKWSRYSDPDLIPMWVADMDFATPAAVLRALRQRLDHGILGYSLPSPSLVRAVCDHLEAVYAWTIQPEWLVWLPGVVPGLNAACRAFAGGMPVVTHTPIYAPFVTAPEHAGVAARQIPLVVRDGRYELNFAGLAAETPKESRLLLLCNPENPGGSLHDRQELLRLLDFARERDLVVCSDEIHCGLVLDAERQHTPFASIGPEAAERAVVLMAPSKTYNIPGLSCAFAVIPNANLRRTFLKTIDGIVPHVNLLGLVGCEAAYRDCAEWHADLIAYLRGNRDLLAERIAQMPGLIMTHPEATYLGWIDCRSAGLDRPADFFEACGVGLADGAVYGAPGFVRLNFACPRAQLEKALDRMQNGLRRR